MTPTMAGSMTPTMAGSMVANNAFKIAFPYFYNAFRINLSQLPLAIFSMSSGL